MTDPFADLERELLAAHARGARPRVPFPRMLALAVALAAAVVFFFGVRGDAEQAVRPQPVSGGTPADCSAPGGRFQPALTTAPAPQAIASELAVLREPRPEADAERHFVSTQAHRLYGHWRALGLAGPLTVAVVAADIVPRAQVKMQRDGCTAPEGTVEPGVCLHLGMPEANGGTVACFTRAELLGGTAFIDVDGDIVGLAPDGARTAAAGSESTAVRDNVFWLPGGPETEVEFRPEVTG